MKRKKVLQDLQARLERMHWPAIYPFKFIVPIEKLNEVLDLFEKQESQTKLSRKGNYASVTVTPLMYNSEKVIEKYEEAFKIEGLMAL